MLPEPEAALWRQFFDFWRRAYPFMDYLAHREFYNMVARQFPDQQRYDASAVATALTAATAMYRRPRVWELGGWNGALALEMLKAFPEIRCWDNYEICTDPMIYVCKQGEWDERYHVRAPGNWAWELGDYADHQIAIMSHVVEHLSWNHFVSLVDHLQYVPLLYIQMPESMGEEAHPTQWMGTMSTHKLEVGWHIVRGYLERNGYTQLWHKEGARLFGK